MIGDMKGCFLPVREFNGLPIWQRIFRVEHQAPNIGLWDDTRTSATTGCVKLLQLEQLDHIVEGRQPERRFLDRNRWWSLEEIVTLRLLTSLQPMVCRMLWVVRAADAFIRKP